MSKKVLIIGGVAGGASVAARLRRLDENSDIVVFERGSYISFANCGLPYYIGGIIQERSALLVQTSEDMARRFNLDIRTKNEVISINREKQFVTVKNHTTHEEYTENYDNLVIATGSSPTRPGIPGIHAPNIFTLWNIPDTDKVKSFIDTRHPKRAVVIGGGFIGIEMSENLRHLGIDVTLVDIASQVMPSFDYDMAQYMHRHMEDQGITLILKDGVNSFNYHDGITTVTTCSGKEIDADFVMLSIGVKPNNFLASESGLKMNKFGGIEVNDYLQTSDKNIYAVGDVIGVKHAIAGDTAMIPLAGPANKQGRICANNICGMKEKYNGTLGTSVAKVFDLTVASTGLNEKQLLHAGKKIHKDYCVLHLHPGNHAGYYPGSSRIHLKVLFDAESGLILGAQAVGNDGTDKRIDVISTAMHFKASINDLKELELSYAPPFSSAKDPVNMAGFYGANMMEGHETNTQWYELDNLDFAKYAILDVRNPEEQIMGKIPGSVDIPVDSLRKRLKELDKSKTYVVTCAQGIRAWIAIRILQQNGFKVRNLSGGFTTYEAVFYNDPDHIEFPDMMDKGDGSMTNDYKDQQTLIPVNACGLQCPGPIMKLFEAVKNANKNDIIEVRASDMGFGPDVKAWARRTGNTLLNVTTDNGIITARVQKGQSAEKQAETVHASAHTGDNSKSMVVFSGDLDKAIASFIIANGAAAMGRKVTMFFTFWGLNILRKNQRVRVKKNFIERMFGMMMPRGARKLSLSKMNMGGMGSKMMKKIMKNKNVTSLEDLMKQAMDNGVNMIACTMSMDVMGIRKEEMVDGIDYAGVANFLGSAEEADTTLFI